MIELNKVLLVGRLTRDPEDRYTNSGTQITTFSLAVNRRRGRDNEEVSYIDCTAWDKTAEFVSKWFSKGKPIFIEGRLQQDRWEDKNTGEKRSKLIVVADRAGFVGGKNDDQDDEQQAQRRQQSRSSFPGNEPEPKADDDDDMPF